MARYDVRAIHLPVLVGTPERVAKAREIRRDAINWIAAHEELEVDAHRELAISGRLTDG